jgi:hypothetical protein
MSWSLRLAILAVAALLFGGVLIAAGDPFAIYCPKLTSGGM